MVDKKEVVKYSLYSAIVGACYVALIATFMANAEALFGKMNGGPFGIMGFLMLFVLSAAVMGTLLFGRPLLWYFDGKKKEAVTLTLYTVGFFAILTLGVLLILSL